MPRQNQSAIGFMDAACKIRKRNSPSSASSSLLQSYRFKRAILVGKRGGSTTPAPNWRMNPKTPSSNSRVSESSRCNGTTQGPVSARKLANALWELNKIPSPQFSAEIPVRRTSKVSRSFSHRLSDPSHSPVSETIDRSRCSSRRRITPKVSERVWCGEHSHNVNLMEIDARSQGLTPKGSTVGTMSHLKDLRSCLTSSKELLRLLSQIWGLEGQHSYGISLFSALRVELDRAKVQVDNLIQNKKLGHDEMNCLKKRFMEEKLSWKCKERERITATVHSILDELESEKKLRRRAERLNKKLGLELASTRASLLKAVKELEKQRRSREIIEQVCNEIVRGVGEDKAEVDQLKREASNVREELEKEREMLRLADEWREERVQMKLLEAKVQFEEKNAAVDQLRNELEAFLETKRTKEESQSTSEVDDGEEGDDDLHSIELNMESDNKGFGWSYALKVAESHSNLLALAEENNEAKRTSEHLGGDLDLGRLSESKSFLEKRPGELDHDAETYISVKQLRDRMLAGTRIVLPRGFTSPTRQWKKSQTLHENVGRVAEMVTVRESGSRVRLVGNNRDSV